MWHLGTRIVGTLKDEETPVAELAAALHPTPAVCGLPRRRAAEVISALEGYDRGFYAGAVGWADEQGDGEWYVSIRSARIAGAHATLYAGAGIVAGSDPAAETDETSAKFVAMLSALGIDEHGHGLQEHAA
jgi:isochorismate synthase